MSNLSAKAIEQEAVSVANYPSLVTTAPAGSGKDTMIDMIVTRWPDKFFKSTNHTTREPRPGEVPGESYHFVTEDEFVALEKENAFVENVIVHGKRYGLTRKAVQDVQAKGKICLLTLDVNGVDQVRKQPNIPIVVVWMQAPNHEEQRRRLAARGDSHESIEKRMKTTLDEEAYFSTNQSNFDHTLVNFDRTKTFEELVTIMRKYYPHLD